MALSDSPRLRIRPAPLAPVTASLPVFPADACRGYGAPVTGLVYDSRGISLQCLEAFVSADAQYTAAGDARLSSVGGSSAWAHPCNHPSLLVCLSLILDSL